MMWGVLGHGKKSQKTVFNGVAKKKSVRIYDYDPHSPMFRNRNYSEEKRANLFDDRPFIYGRLPKYLLCFMFCMNLWSGYYIHHRHALAQHQQDKTKKCFRKVVPFVQAMEDVRYVALEQRNYMILKAICDYSGGAQGFDFLRERYSQNDEF